MKRLTIRLPDPAHTALQQRAVAAGEPLASAASNMLRTALEHDDGTPSSRRRVMPRPVPPRASVPGARAPWIAPEADRSWHEQMWGAIVALYERYPRPLARLEHDWYKHAERTETLAALAVWRASIDATGEDPREELAFHTALQQLARTLDQAPGGERRFKPDVTMPAEWGTPKTVDLRVEHQPTDCCMVSRASAWSALAPVAACGPNRHCARRQGGLPFERVALWASEQTHASERSESTASGARDLSGPLGACAPGMTESLHPAQIVTTLWQSAPASPPLTETVIVEGHARSGGICLAVWPYASGACLGDSCCRRKAERGPCSADGCPTAGFR